MRNIDIKESLSDEQVIAIVDGFGGNPTSSGTGFIADTICHNAPGEGSHKLYYYTNSKLFHCYTGGCEQESFDIFELVRKCFRIQKKIEINLPEAINYVCHACGIPVENYEDPVETDALEDWKILNKYSRLEIKTPKSEITLGEYNSSILEYLPRPRIAPWLEEGISQEVLNYNNICYEPAANKIVIPHYDINGRLVGIRGRTLSEEDEVYGKYRPLVLNSIEYKHPLGFNLYCLDKAKKNIALLKKAVVFEGEKSCLLAQTYFGEDYPAVAVCGSNITAYQVNLLLSIGVNEICIAFDRQYKELQDNEWLKWTKKLMNIRNQYCSYATISFLFDLGHALGYKDSPIDRGPDVYNKLYKERIIL